jgi:hypothetical protein
MLMHRADIRAIRVVPGDKKLALEVHSVAGSTPLCNVALILLNYRDCSYLRGSERDQASNLQVRTLCPVTTRLEREIRFLAEVFIRK